MGDGLVLESGTHNDLIQGDGAYARLVRAQKLREGRENTARVGSDDVSEDSGHTVKNDASEEIPLGRKNTGRSLASEILEQKRQQMKASGQNEEREAYSLFYLFRRMSTLVRDQWRNYLIGAVFAYFIFCIYILGSRNIFSDWNGISCVRVVFAKGITGFSLDHEARRHAGDRNALWCVYYSRKTFNCDIFFSL